MGEYVEHLKSYEYDAMLDLMGIATLIKDTRLDERISHIKNGKRDLNLCRTLLAKLMENTINTCDVENLLRMYKSLDRLKIRTGVSAMPLNRQNAVNGLYISFDEMNELSQAAHEKCLGCMLNKHEAKKCRIRKIWDDTNVVTDKPTMWHDCPYRGV